MRKKLLILIASNDICDEEIDHIESNAKIYGIDVLKFNIESPGSLKYALAQGNKFDYIYLCAHANQDYFGDEKETFKIGWNEFSLQICETDCINNNCIFLLACCRGGFNMIAYQLFYNCRNIEYVCGPQWKLKSNDLTIGFNVFMYNMICRNEQPSVSSERASVATNYKFICYERVEVENTDGYLSFSKNLDDSYALTESN